LLPVLGRWRSCHPHHPSRTTVVWKDDSPAFRQTFERHFSNHFHRATTLGLRKCVLGIYLSTFIPLAVYVQYAFPSTGKAPATPTVGLHKLNAGSRPAA
jgi:hypothetical protein